MQPFRISHAIGRYEPETNRHWFIRHDAARASPMLTRDPLDAMRFKSPADAIEWASSMPGEVKKLVSEWPPILIPIRAELAGEAKPMILDAESVL